MSLSHLTKAMSLAVFLPPLCLAGVVTSAISTTLGKWRIGWESLGSHRNFKSVLLAPSVETPHGKQCGRGPDSTGGGCDCTNFTLPLAHVMVLFAVRPSFQWGMQGWVKCMMWPKGLNNVRRKASAGVFTFIHGSQGLAISTISRHSLPPAPLYSLALVVLSYRLKSYFSLLMVGALSTIYSVFIFILPNLY